VGLELATVGVTAGKATTGRGVLLAALGNGVGESAVGVLATGIGGVGGGRGVTTVLMLGKAGTLNVGEMGTLGVT
jgi:hypothetical protein